MTAALDHLIVVGLFGSDVTETGTATHDVSDHAGQFRACDVGNTFLFEADPQTGGCSHAASAGSSGAVNHVDGCNLTFRLNEGSSQRGEELCGRVCDFAGGCDGIAEICFTTGKERAVNDRFIALEQDFVRTFCHDSVLLHDFHDGDRARFGA